MSNDLLSDILTQIRNANLTKTSTTLIPNTKLSRQILKIAEK